MMRHLLPLLLVASVASAQTLPGQTRSGTTTTTCGSTTCSGTAPSASTDGVALQNGYAVRYRICAASGQTLSGAGTVDVYVLDEVDGLWAKVPDLAKTVPAGASGLRCIGFSEAELGVPFGRVAAVPNGVTLSGGNLSVKVYIATK